MFRKGNYYFNAHTSLLAFKFCIYLEFHITINWLSALFSFQKKHTLIIIIIIYLLPIILFIFVGVGDHFSLAYLRPNIQCFGDGKIVCNCIY